MSAKKSLDGLKGINMNTRGFWFVLYLAFPLNAMEQFRPTTAPAAISADKEAELINELGRAAAANDGESVKRILDLHPRLVNSLYFNRTPLIWAASKGHDRLIQFLLNKGAQIHARGDHDFTPLHFAANYGHKSAVLLLLKAGASKDDCMEWNLNAAALARRSGHAGVAQVIDEWQKGS